MNDGKPMSRKEFVDMMEVIQKKTTLDENKMMLYVLTPYLATLGYKIFNIDDVETDFEAHTIKVKVSSDFSTMIGLENFYPYDEDINVFLYVDIHTKAITLSMKALGEWEILHTVQLEGDTEEDEKTYQKIVTFLEVKSVQEMYAKKHTRMFTEGVLRSKLLREEYDNSFIRAIIREELKNPSKQLLSVIASGLNQKFSSDSVTNITHGLSEMSGKTLMEIITNVSDEISREDYEIYANQHKKVEKELNVQEAPNLPKIEEEEEYKEAPEYGKEEETKGSEDPELEYEEETYDIYDEVDEEDTEELEIVFDIVDEEETPFEPSLVFDVVEGNTEDEQDNIFGLPKEGSPVKSLEDVFGID